MSSAPFWTPSASGLVWENGRWRARHASSISYPDSAGDHCFAVEDNSYWFRHRTACLLTALDAFPPAGTFYDIGGGNGQFVLALEESGRDAVLVEPGVGAENGRRRGVGKIVQATLEDAEFTPASVDAIGVFDVVEHIENDEAFLRTLHAMLRPGGRLYCTVPAFPSLWSAEDEHAGHFRRYRTKSLTDVVTRSGFTVEFVSYFFTWLTLPLALFRALPHRTGLVRRDAVGTAEAMQADHKLPSLLNRPIEAIHRWERHNLRAQKTLPFGTSILCVAKADSI